MPFPPRGLWSSRPGDGRSLFRGKCRNETLAVQAGSPFRGSAKHSRPWQGLVQQRVTNPGGTAGLSTPKDRQYGSDPPENGPSLHARPFGEVAPGIFPCRKASQPGGSARCCSKACEPPCVAYREEVRPLGEAPEADLVLWDAGRGSSMRPETGRPTTSFVTASSCHAGSDCLRRRATTKRRWKS